MSQRRTSCVWFCYSLPAIAAGTPIASTKMAEFEPSDPLVPLHSDFDRLAKPLRCT